MVTNCLSGFYLFSSLAMAQAGQSINPFRIALIAAVGLLWLICFSALFFKDRRKVKIRFLQKRGKARDYTEKRRSERVSYPMPVRYHVTGPREIAGTIMVSNARNLSEGGILLEIKEDLPLGTELELKLTLSGKGDSLYVRGIVQRKEWMGSLGVYAVGVALHPANPDERAKLLQFIEQEKARESRGESVA